MQIWFQEQSRMLESACFFFFWLIEPTNPHHALPRTRHKPGTPCVSVIMLEQEPFGAILLGFSLYSNFICRVFTFIAYIQLSISFIAVYFCNLSSCLVKKKLWTHFTSLNVSYLSFFLFQRPSWEKAAKIMRERCINYFNFYIIHA